MLKSVIGIFYPKPRKGESEIHLFVILEERYLLSSDIQELRAILKIYSRNESSDTAIFIITKSQDTRYICIPESHTNMQKMRCSICGHIFDPAFGESNVTAGTDFTDVPDTWVCPVCQAKKDLFVPV